MKIRARKGAVWWVLKPSTTPAGVVSIRLTLPRTLTRSLYAHTSGKAGHGTIRRERQMAYMHALGTTEGGRWTRFDVLPKLSHLLLNGSKLPYHWYPNTTGTYEARLVWRGKKISSWKSSCGSTKRK